MFHVNKALVGVAGEYYVAAELSKRGYLASITLRNSENIDIICSNQKGTKSMSIQVKTSSSKVPKWILTKKSEDRYSDKLFYVFVLLKDLGAMPEYYIVPSKEVANYIRNSHKEWLKGTKKNGECRKDSSMRIYEDKEMEYKNRWDLLPL
jgi:hypothetical protein